MTVIAGLTQGCPAGMVAGVRVHAWYSQEMDYAFRIIGDAGAMQGRLSFRVSLVHGGAAEFRARRRETCLRLQAIKNMLLLASGGGGAAIGESDPGLKYPNLPQNAQKKNFKSS